MLEAPTAVVPTAKPIPVVWPAWLFFIFVLLPVVLPVAVETFLFGYFLFFPLIVWMNSSRKDHARLLRIISPLLLLTTVGLVGAYHHKMYDVGKDVWYVLNAVLALAVGYVLMLNLRDLDRLFRIFIITATFIALLHLLRFAFNPSLLGMDADQIRRFVGEGYFAPGIALALFLAARKMGVSLFGKHTWFSVLSLCLCALSVAASFSRILLVSLLILLLTIIGWIHFNDRKKVLYILIGTTLAALVAFNLPAPRLLGSHSSLSDKFLHSVQEIRVKDYVSIAEINQNWRGYETARALRTFRQGTPAEYIVGQGFGALVDLGLAMPLGAEKIRFAPVLHNGYMYVLVKTGVAGLLLYLLTLVRVGATGVELSRSDDKRALFAGRLLIALGLIFAVSTFVISGMFNKMDLLSVSLLTGALLGYYALQESVLKEGSHEAL